MLPMARLSLPVTLVVLLLSGATGGCTPSPPASHDGPIVVVTFGALRADAVGAVGAVGGLGGALAATPELDRLTTALISGAEPGWAGRAVASSSWGAPSAASLVTGLGPWALGVIDPERIELDLAVPTFAEVASAAGYRTSAYPSGYWLRGRSRITQGFDFVHFLRDPDQIGRPTGHLRSLGDGDAIDARQLIWIHLDGPEPPFARRDDLAAAAGLDDARVAELPERLEVRELAPFWDPRRQPRPELQAAILDLYRLEVAAADRRLGELLGALRDSGRWDDTLLVVTSLHGIDLDDPAGGGRLGVGGDLSRAVLEVPLVVKLPRELERSIPHRTDRPVASQRLFATLVDSLGLPRAPAVAPSLFDPVAGPILSELYLAGEENVFSLVLPTARKASDTPGEPRVQTVAGTSERVAVQLVREVPFSPPEPSFYRARLVSLGVTGAAGPDDPPPEAVFDRLRRRFDRTPPLSGDATPGDRRASRLPTPRQALRSWHEDGSVQSVREDPREAELGRLLRRTWLASGGTESSPTDAFGAPQDRRP